MIKKLPLMILTAFSLSACSTIEIIHVPVGCLGQPVTSLNLTKDEFDTIAPTALKKVAVFATTLRKRIDSQCYINLNHDKLHGGEE